MSQLQGVAQLVHRLNQQAIGEQVEIAWQAVEILREPVVRDDGAGAAHLGFAEDESENGK